MSTRAWQTADGRIECHWNEGMEHSEYRPPWMLEELQAHGSYLAPNPDFASHSPFGGNEEWFRLHLSK